MNNVSGCLNRKSLWLMCVGKSSLHHRVVDTRVTSKRLMCKQNALLSGLVNTDLQGSLYCNSLTNKTPMVNILLTL